MRYIASFYAIHCKNFRPSCVLRKAHTLIVRFYPSLRFVARIQHLNNALILRMSGVVPSPRHTGIEWLWCHCRLQGRQRCRRLRSDRSGRLAWNARACWTWCVE